MEPLEERRFRCNFENCTSSFSRKWNLVRHEQRYHNVTYSESCLLCKKVFTENRKLQEHLLLDHGPSEKFILKESAFEQTITKYRFTFEDNEINFNNGQNRILEEIKETIRFEAVRKTMVKVCLVYICQMSMQNLDGEKVHSTLIPFRSSSFITNGLRNSSLSIKIRNSFKQQENFLEDFCDTGSNWIFDRAVAFDIEIAAIKPLVMGSNKDDSFLQSSLTRMKHKKLLYDPENNNEKCFLYCLYALLREKKSFKTWEKKLNLKGIKFPISINHIKKFVKINPELDIRINILFRNLLTFVYPYECGIGNGKKIINLLMVEKVPILRKHVVIERHFMGIIDIDKFLATRYVNNETSKCSYTRSNYCLNCFNQFKTNLKLKEHERICLTKKPIIENVPLLGHTLEFKNFAYQHQQDYIAFLDFECLLYPNGELKKCNQCERIRCKCDKSFSEIINHQEPFAYSFVILDSQNNIIHEKTYVGAEAAINFIDHLIHCWRSWIHTLLERTEEMIYTRNDYIDFTRAECCYLCQKNFESQNLMKNRDHNHHTGKYLGAACTSCNLKRKRIKKIPIFLHNGSRYDFHFIIRALHKKNIGEIRILPYNGEHFRTIEFQGFKFIDSLAFLQASLSQLTEDLSKTNHDYSILKQTFLVKKNENFCQKKFEILMKKSYYPYEYCTNLELMKNTVELPDISNFYSTLREESIQQSEYDIAKRVWRIFKCKNLLDYTRIYCKLDTILLAEIFQKFRHDMHKFSNLDPSYYISLPSFAFDSMMKLTNCKLELMSDIDMIQFIESSIRGGVSFINNRYLKAEYKKAEEIVYIDANVSLNIFIFIMNVLILFILFFSESLWTCTNV